MMDSGTDILYGSFARQTVCKDPDEILDPDVFTARVTLIEDEQGEEGLLAEERRGARLMLLKMVICSGEHQGAPVTVRIPADPGSFILRKLVNRLFPSADGTPFSGELSSEDLIAALCKVSFAAKMEYHPDGNVSMRNLLVDTVEPLE